MNEPTIKLYKQAQEFAYKNISKEYWNTDNFHAVVSGKFAELIVRECAEFANEHNEEVEGVTLGVGQALKKHFGLDL